MLEGLNKLATKLHYVDIKKDHDELGSLLMDVTHNIHGALEAHTCGHHGIKEQYERHTALLRPEDSVRRAKEFKTYIADTFEDEIAKAFINILDIAGKLGIDLEFHTRERLQYV